MHGICRSQHLIAGLCAALHDQTLDNQSSTILLILSVRRTLTCAHVCLLACSFLRSFQGGFKTAASIAGALASLRTRPLGDRGTSAMYTRDCWGYMLTDNMFTHLEIGAAFKTAFGTPDVYTADLAARDMCTATVRLQLLMIIQHTARQTDNTLVYVS
jgi:hypothetical protein